MMQYDKRLVGGVTAGLLVAAAGGFAVARYTASTPGATTSQPEKREAAEAPANAVEITPARAKEAGIMVEPVGAGGLGSEIVAQAVVVASPTGEAVVTARAGGTVTRVLKRLGDPVGAGEVLAIVESRDAAQIAAERTTAAAKATLAQRALARERYLYDQKVSARVDLEQAEAEAVSTAAEVRRAQAAASAANVTRDGRGVVVASPIAGRVTVQSISLGAFVQPETELFRISDPRSVQIEAAVGPADATRLVAGDRAVVELADGSVIEARVRSVTPTLSRDTRSATAVLDLGGRSLQPGLAVRVRLFPSRSAASGAIVVPEEALQSLGGRDVVFVRTGKGFEAKPVTTGQRSAGRIEILSGLGAGQTIATRNAFLLKAELAKGAGGDED